MLKASKPAEARAQGYWVAWIVPKTANWTLVAIPVSKSTADKKKPLRLLTQRLFYKSNEI